MVDSFDRGLFGLHACQRTHFYYFAENVESLSKHESKALLCLGLILEDIVGGYQAVEIITYLVREALKEASEGALWGHRAE